MAYGSGEPVDYRNYSRFLSPQSTWDTADTWMFGDSITFGGRDQLRTRIEAAPGDHTIAFDAWSARPTAPAVASLAERFAAGPLPQRIIMACGTNDIYNPPVMANLISEVLSMTNSQDCDLIWVDTFAMRSNFVIADLINSAWVNEQIHARDEDMYVVGWHRMFAKDKGRIAARLSDGIHPIDGQGDDFWAATIMTVLSGLLV